MNKSKRKNSDAPWDQGLDKFDKFWIDLNEATAILPEAKAQIYSVNENLPQTKSLECETSLISSKELAEKRKGWRSRRQESKLQVVKFVYLDVYQSLQ